MVKAERVSDRNRHLPDTHTPGIAEACPGQGTGVEAQNREIGMWIVADEIAARRAAVR